MRRYFGHQRVATLGVGIGGRAGMRQDVGDGLDPPRNAQMRWHEAGKAPQPPLGDAASPVRDIHRHAPGQPGSPGMDRCHGAAAEMQAGPGTGTQDKRRALATLGPDFRSLWPDRFWS